MTYDDAWDDRTMGTRPLWMTLSPPGPLHPSYQWPPFATPGQAADAMPFDVLDGMPPVPVARTLPMRPEDVPHVTWRLLAAPPVPPFGTPTPSAPRQDPRLAALQRRRDAMYQQAADQQPISDAHLAELPDPPPGSPPDPALVALAADLLHAERKSEQALLGPLAGQVGTPAYEETLDDFAAAGEALAAIDFPSIRRRMRAHPDALRRRAAVEMAGRPEAPATPVGTA